MQREEGARAAARQKLHARRPEAIQTLLKTRRGLHNITTNRRFARYTDCRSIEIISTITHSHKRDENRRVLLFHLELLGLRRREVLRLDERPLGRRGRLLHNGRAYVATRLEEGLRLL